jgi:hypothetical protein
VDPADGLAFLGLDNKALVKPGGTAGTWNVTSAVSFGIASRGPSANWFNGTLAHVAIWNDRFPGDAARLWLNSIAFGG